MQHTMTRDPRDAAAEIVEDIESRLVGYDGFGAPLYAHQIAPEGQE